MPLTNLHTIATHQGYVLLRDLEIKRFENDKLLAGTDLSGLGPLPDNPANSAFIGYGIDFRNNSLADIQAWYMQANLSAFLTSNDLTLMANYRTNPTSANRQALLNSFTHLPDEPAATRVLAAAVDARETEFNARLGFVMPESNERAALMSMFYNGGAGIIGSSLLNALQNDNRAEAWFEIRYNSNGGTSSGRGIANRRYAESNTFGLYDTVPPNEAEAKSIFHMYTAHRETIYTYEGNSQTSPGTGESFASRASYAHTTLLSLSSQKPEPFGPGTVSLPSIDGEVLVGNDDLRGDLFDVRQISIPGVPAYIFDLSKNDLMFGEGGRDTLHGHGGSDVLYGGAAGDELYGDEGEDYLFGGDGEDSLQGGDHDDALFGGAGNDQLVGGKGDDKLAGGAGFDTYIYTSGDGNDRIEDSDASGVIIVNGKPLAGGVKKAGHTDWISADGTLKYVMQGTDLVVKLNDVMILTVNENFQSGQFNIKLIDAPTVSTQLPTTTRTIVGDFDPLDTDPAEPGIQIDYDELGNFIQDTESPNDRSDLLNGSAGNDTINGGAMNDRLTALGGNDIGICLVNPITGPVTQLCRVQGYGFDRWSDLAKEAGSLG